MRQSEYLRERYHTILSYSGNLMMVLGILFLAPLLLLPIYPDEINQATALLLPGIALILLSLSLWKGLSPNKATGLEVKEGMVIVVFVWITAIFFGAFPFMLANDLNFTQAVFESTSGWTTTGLSVINVEETSHLLLFFRSTMQMAGGAGFAILALTTLSRASGIGLSTAEGRSDQLAPNVRRSARIVLRMYIGYIIFGFFALLLAGMSPFDAINHAFTAISTGGFSTRSESIGYWDSIEIEAVIIVLMLLGTINFLTAYTILRRKFQPVSRNGELQLLVIVLSIAIILFFAVTTAQVYPSLDKSLRAAIFETISALSTCGFSTVGYANWNDFGWLVLISLMIVGGGIGSTAGGIKLYRLYVLLKGLIWEFRRPFLPQHTVNQPSIWHGDRRTFLVDKQIRQVALYLFLYLIFLLIGSLITTAHGYTIKEGFFEFASTLSTVGLSVGVTSPDAPLSLLWSQIVGMFLGRLEFFAVIIGITKFFVDANNMIFSREDAYSLQK